MSFMFARQNIYLFDFSAKKGNFLLRPPTAYTYKLHPRIIPRVFDIAAEIVPRMSIASDKSDWKIEENLYREERDKRERGRKGVTEDIYDNNFDQHALLFIS